MPRVLAASGPRTLTWLEEPERPLEAGEVRLRTVLSGISHGTELNLYRGTSAFADRRFDAELRAFVPSEQEPGPIPLGYELVGAVEEIGPGIADVEPGMLVHAPLPHADGAIVSLVEPTDIGYPATVLPAGVDAEAGLFTALGCVALFAVHDAEIRLGDVVSVHGLGAIGLLAGQLARSSGATVVGIDPIARRREAAAARGFDAVFDPATTGPVEIKRELGSSGVDTAIEVSGAVAGLHQAIATVRMGGRVVSAGFYQGGATALHLGEEWHHNRVDMVSSMGVWGCPHRAAPRWDRVRVAATVARLLGTGELDTAGLVTHRVPHTAASEAYELIDRRPDETIKVALSYAGR